MSQTDLERGVIAARTDLKNNAKLERLRQRGTDGHVVDIADHADALHDPERRFEPLKRKLS